MTNFIFHLPVFHPFSWLFNVLSVILFVMKRVFIVLILFLSILSSCEKKEPEPNENWTAGSDWIDTREGQSYATVKIGDQIWMAENLNYDAGEYSHMYESFEIEGNYGRLYDWETACYVCLGGWHLPTSYEWDELSDYLGAGAGGKMKETGSTLWYSPNIGATNSSGFTALPGGMCNEDHVYGFTMTAYFWSAKESWTSYYDAIYYFLYHSDSILFKSANSKDYGRSVRCIKNE